MRRLRNCANRLGLSDAARAVTRYTGEIEKEHEEKGARKVRLLGDIRLYECPVTYISAETAAVIRVLGLIETSGHLLHAGGWGNQPHWLVEAYVIFKAEQAAELKRRQEG